MNCTLVPVFQKEWTTLGQFMMPSLESVQHWNMTKWSTSVSMAVPWLKVKRARWDSFLCCPKIIPRECSLQHRNTLIQIVNFSAGWEHKIQWVSVPVLCSQALSVVLALGISALAWAHPKVRCGTWEASPRIQECSAGLEWGSAQAGGGWNK